MKPRVLVLGSTGFIGCNVLEALTNSANFVAIAGRRRGGGERAGIEARIFDARDEGATAEALTDIDVVVNCIAGGPRTMTASTQALMSATSRLRSWPRIIHISSMMVYGNITGTVDEAFPLTADRAGYAGAKVACEVLLRDYPAAVILRPGCVYGPGSWQWSGRIAHWLLSHRLGDLGVAGDGRSNLIHIDDLVRAILTVAQVPDIEGEIFNMAQPDAPRWNEYFGRYARTLGAVPIRRITSRQLALQSQVFAPPLKIMQLISSRVERRLRTPPAMPPSLLRLWRRDIRLDMHKGLQRLGLTWTPLQRGLLGAADWYAGTTQSLIDRES